MPTCSGGAKTDVSDNNGFTALHWCAFRGAVSPRMCDIAHMLVSAGADVNAVTNPGDTVLCFAIDSGNRELVKQLLRGCPTESTIQRRYATNAGRSLRLGRDCPYTDRCRLGSGGRRWQVPGVRLRRPQRSRKHSSAPNRGAELRRAPEPTIRWLERMVGVIGAGPVTPVVRGSGRYGHGTSPASDHARRRSRTRWQPT